MRKTVGVLVLSLIFIGQLIAQPICGTDEIHKKLIETDPGYRKQLAEQEELILRYTKNPPKIVTQHGVALYTIPVVVHIVHTGGELGSIYNPTDAQITSVIDYLNKVYDGTATGMTGGVGDVQIQFVLAKRDPNCNPTNGIVHVNGSSLSGYAANGVNRENSNGASDIAMKNLSRWDATQYYNIWVVNKIDGKDGTSGQFIAGYAYYPGASTSVDGSVMLATTMKVGDKVLPHEIGHALNLAHPFEGSSGAGVCPPNDNCSTQGDRVCDTDPVSYNVNASGVYDFTCRTGNNPCTNTLYSVNTENNIMSYTNCFTLFTAGQKTRMMAAMSLSSRASLANSMGATPPGQGAVVCPPKINFAIATASIPEATTATSGCTGYKDYVFDMTIGAAPSATATVTLSAGGTATSGADYIISTNGDFTVSSLQLSFPAGATTNRQFTVRVLDDAAIESNETIILDFTVSNGGGNAQKGSAIVTSTLTIQDNDVVPQWATAQQAQIGTSTVSMGTAANGSCLFNGKNKNMKTLMLYKASELTAMGFTAGTITHFGVYLNKNSILPFLNLSVKMGATTVANLVSSGTAYGVSGTVTVATLPSYNTVNGLNLFALDVPFSWNGTSNIAVEICYDNGAGNAGQLGDVALGFYDGTASGEGNVYFTAAGNCSSAFTGNISYYQTVKPTAYFVINKPGPTIETVLSASNNVLIGPNADVFIYSTSGNILARIKNLSAFNYGCTEVRIDRAGGTAKNYTNTLLSDMVADKTISITPTNPNISGSFEVTLYYTAAEVQGWKNATGQTWASAKLLKTPAAVSSYGPGTVAAGDVLSPAATKGAYGADSIITATFTTANLQGGFAVGNPDLTATTLYTFTGNGLWTVASNWANGLIPPDNLPSGHRILISPAEGGNCILNKQQNILPGATIIVSPGKELIIQGNLQQ